PARAPATTPLKCPSRSRVSGCSSSSMTTCTLCRAGAQTRKSTPASASSAPTVRRRVMRRKRATIIPAMNLLHLFDLSLQDRREQVALEWAGRTYTFGEIERRSNRVAHALLAQGFAKGDRL